MNRRAFLQTLSAALCGAALGVRLTLGPMASRRDWDLLRPPRSVKAFVHYPPIAGDRRQALIEAVVDGRRYAKVAEVSGRAVSMKGFALGNRLMSEQIDFRLAELTKDVEHVLGEPVRIVPGYYWHSDYLDLVKLQEDELKDLDAG